MKIAFLGAGNMGGAMIRAAAGSALLDCPGGICVYDKDAAKAERFGTECGVTVCRSNAEAVCAADVAVLAVKPIFVNDVLQEIKDLLNGKLLVSIAAGVSVKRFTDILGEIPMVRTIPNLPAMVGEGISGIYFAHMERCPRAEEFRKTVIALFETFGKVCVVERESLIDEMIAVTSSSPGYICLLTEAMADGAVRAGFPRETAYQLVEQTLLGTARYLMETGLHPAVMKDMICSPGGTTIEAVASLERSGFRSDILQAMDICAKKAKNIL